MILWHVGLTWLIVWFVMRGNPRIDYRVVAFASLIPDLIDKPIGLVFFRERYGSGRIYAHSLVLNLALFCLLFFMRGRSKRRFALVPISSLLHLAEDGVWSNAHVFWWPLFGTTFPRQRGGLLASFNVTAVWQEAVGLAAILFLLSAHGMLSRDGLRAFLRTGMFEPPKGVAR